MPLRLKDQEFIMFRDFIEKECGVLLGKDKAYLIENRLSKIATDYGCKTFSEFYQKVSRSSRADKIRLVLVDAITTHETLWFRDQGPFRILEERIFPEYQSKIKSGGCDRIYIWSAACATGQEPYSIAMTALEYYLKSGYEEKTCFDQVSILGTDVSVAALDAAIRSRYDENTMARGMPNEYLKRYFIKENNEWILSPRIKQMITFRQLNLIDPLAGIIGPFDIIFLRNVIIYFSEEFKKILFNRIVNLLNPGGYLFLGTGETVGGYTEAFDVMECELSIFYRLK